MEGGGENVQEISAELSGGGKIWRLGGDVRD
jgi:hypothetical protein